MSKKRKEANLDEDLYEDDDDTQKDKYLTFCLGDEGYGIAINHVTEIVGIQKITEIPDVPSFIKGVINLRGKVIPVMDVRDRFDLDSRVYDDRTCIIVVNIHEELVGMVVDTVKEVAYVPESDVEPCPSVGKNTHSRFVQGLGKIDIEEVIILLNVNRLIHDEDLAELSAVA